jgi:PAS domain-containing protein
VKGEKVTEVPTKSENYLKTILDAIPVPVLVADHETRITDANRAALQMIGDEPEFALRRLCGEVLHCLHALRAPDGCGTTEYCSDCAIRKSIEKTRQGQATTRSRYEMKTLRDGEERNFHLLVTASPFDFEGEPLVLLILEDMTELMELRNLLPICANCKKIRGVDEYWEQLESYLSKHTDLDFTHSICPDCVAELYPELGTRQKSDG